MSKLNRNIFYDVLFRVVRLIWRGEMVCGDPIYNYIFKMKKPLFIINKRGKKNGLSRFFK